MRSRWDSLDHPFFPRNGLRANAEFFTGAVPGDGDSDNDITRGEANSCRRGR